MKKLILVAIFLLMAPGSISAQDADKAVQGQAYPFVGPFVPSPNWSGGGVNAGFGAEVLYRGEIGGAFEGGFARSSNGASVGTGAVDFSYHFIKVKHRSKIEPFAVGGYSLYFGHDLGDRSTESGYNIGAGVNFWVSKRVGLRFDVRDYGGIKNEFLGIRSFCGFRFGVTFR